MMMSCPRFIDDSPSGDESNLLILMIVFELIAFFKC